MLSDTITLASLFEKEIIDEFDDKFDWTLSHGFAASSTSKECVPALKRFLDFIESMGKQRQLLTKDKDGDIPLQSAVRSKAHPDIIRLLLTRFPQLTKDMLEKVNAMGENPLMSAFEIRHWGAVMVILELCITHRVLSKQTGVGQLSEGDHFTTLLDEASKRGDVEYFDIFFGVCKKEGANVDISTAISVPNKHGVTAWYHVIQLSRKKLKKVLSVLKKNNIDLNTLYVRSNSKSTMLHEAARKNSKECEKLLKEYGALEKKDSNGLLPDDRRRVFSGHQSLTGKQQQGSAPSQEVEQCVAIADSYPQEEVQSLFFIINLHY